MTSSPLISHGCWFRDCSSRVHDLWSTADCGCSPVRISVWADSFSILPRVRAKGKTKGVIPGGITPIRRSRTTLLPAEGPPLPFRPRLPSRTDQSWAGLGSRGFNPTVRHRLYGCSGPHKG